MSNTIQDLATSSNLLSSRAEMAQMATAAAVTHGQVKDELARTYGERDAARAAFAKLTTAHAAVVSQLADAAHELAAEKAAHDVTRAQLAALSDKVDTAEKALANAMSAKP